MSFCECEDKKKKFISRRVMIKRERDSDRIYMIYKISQEKSKKIRKLKTYNYMWFLLPVNPTTQEGNE